MKIFIFAAAFLAVCFSRADEPLKLKSQSLASANGVEIVCGEKNEIKIKSLLDGQAAVQTYTFEIKDACVQMKLLLKLVDADCPIVLNTTPKNTVDSAELSCDIDQQKMKKGVME